MRLFDSRAAECLLPPPLQQSSVLEVHVCNACRCSKPPHGALATCCASSHCGTCRRVDGTVAALWEAAAAIVSKEQAEASLDLKLLSLPLVWLAGVAPNWLLVVRPELVQQAVAVPKAAVSPAAAGQHGTLASPAIHAVAAATMSTLPAVARPRP